MCTPAAPVPGRKMCQPMGVAWPPLTCSTEPSEEPLIVGKGQEEAEGTTMRGCRGASSTISEDPLDSLRPALPPNLGLWEEGWRLPFPPPSTPQFLTPRSSPPPPPPGRSGMFIRGRLFLVGPPLHSPRPSPSSLFRPGCPFSGA